MDDQTHIQIAPDRTVAAPDQITVVSTIYHVPENVDDPTVSCEVRWSKKLLTKQQPFHRRLTVGSEPIPLDGCWLSAASMLVVVNREGCDLRTIPTQEERDEMALRTVQLSVNGQPFGYVAPFGGPFMGNPGPLLAGITLRCLEGVARVLVWVFPE